MADTIDNLSIEISANANAAVQSLTRLQNAIKPLGGAGQAAAGGMQTMAASVKGAGTVTQKAGEQAGEARPNIKGVGKDAKDAGDKAKKGTSGISSFWKALKRVAFYRSVRWIIKEISEAFKEGATNLYQWSKATGKSDFAKNMDRIATSVNYLKNSLGAMLEPVVRILAPIIDWIVDRVVEVINLVNQFFAALSGAQTYTVAKKVAVEWDKTDDKVKQTANDIKRTILGFDEINKLQDNKSPSASASNASNIGDLFETKPLEGWAKALSDFINGLKEKFAPIMQWIDDLKEKISSIWDGFINGAKDFFSDPLDWLDRHVAQPIISGLKNLFGIHSPSRKMKEVGESLIQGLKNGMSDELIGIDKWLNDNIVIPIIAAIANADVPTLYFAPKLNNKASVLYNNFKDDWDNSGSKTLYFSPRLDNKAQVVYDNFKRDWDDSGSKTLYFSPRLDNSAKVLYDRFKDDWDNAGSKTLYFSPRLDNTAKVLYDNFKKAWDDAGSKTLYFSPKLDNAAKVLYDNFKKAWDDAGSKVLYFSPRLDNAAKVLYDLFKSAWDNAGSKVLYFSPKLDNEASVLWKQFKDGWLNARTALYASPKLDNSGSVLFNGLKAEWINSRTSLFASPKLDNKGSVLWNTFKGEWDASNPVVTAKVALEKSGWDTISGYLDNNFGTASGGGGHSSGGGSGRGRHGVGSYPVDVVVDAVAGSGISKTNGILIPNVGNTDAYVYLERTWDDPLATLGLTGLFTTVKASLDTDDWGTVIKNTINNLLNSGTKSSTKVSGAATKVSKSTKKKKKALGGYFSNGIWGEIPQFANGVLDMFNGLHGSLFLAGEAGPEIVGHVGGRTEVLNKSQLAAAMYSAVHSAMQGVTLDANFYGGGSNNSEGGGMTVDINDGKIVTLLNEVRGLLMQINDKELSVSTTAMNKAQSYMNRRAGATIVPVGT